MLVQKKTGMICSQEITLQVCGAPFPISEESPLKLRGFTELLSIRPFDGMARREKHQDGRQSIEAMPILEYQPEISGYERLVWLYERITELAETDRFSLSVIA